jgi:hypothetical protein
VTAKTILLTGDIYTADALRQTIEAFSRLCEAKFTGSEANSFLLDLSCSQERIQDEFLNHALALSAQERLA